MSGSPVLALDDFRRYGRQMILNNFSLQGQTKLLSSSICVVGAGGLGCPAIQYLAAAGVGLIGIVDNDVVDLSNLQRQVLHSESKISMSKADSAARFVHDLNSKVKVRVHDTRLTPSNARQVLGDYDIILDCTDNAPTRYLLSDACVELGKPLVSGAALRFDGQLCVYNYDGGPCYRCLFPKPPTQLESCEAFGVLGPVTGVIGTLQALEAIKMVTSVGMQPPSLLIYSALTHPPFRSIKLRSKKPDCLACGSNKERSSLIDQSDYLEYCGSHIPDWEALGAVPGDPQLRINANELSELLKSREGEYLLLDVRPKAEFGICQLPNSTNVPIEEFVANPLSHISHPERGTIVVCRLGNDSQIATAALNAELRKGTSSYPLARDLIGGLKAWSSDIDQEFPMY